MESTLPETEVENVVKPRWLVEECSLPMEPCSTSMLERGCQLILMLTG